MKHLLTFMQQKVFWDLNFVVSFLRLHNYTIFVMCCQFIWDLWNSLYKVWGPPGPPFSCHLATWDPPGPLGPPILVTFHLANNPYWIKACSKFSFAKRIRGLASKLAELEPFSFEWWKMVKNSRFWHNRQISANLCIFPNFLFRRHGHIFQRKLVLSFSLTHKLLIFYVCEVASIFVHSRLREKRIFWGGEITPSR